MAKWYFILVLGMLLGIAAAKPAQNSKHSSHKRAVKTKRTPTCIVAGDLLGDIIEGVSLSEENMESIQNVILGATGIDVFSEADRNSFFCSLSDLDTLSQLLSALENLNLDMKAAEAIYFIFRSWMRHELESTVYRLDYYSNMDDQLYNYPDDEMLDNLNIRLNLYNAIEATGLLDLESEGGAWVDLFMVLFGYPLSDNDDYTPTPHSDQPLSAQCAIIANNVREVWNDYIEDVKEYDPEVSERTKDMIRQWTGIEMSSHGHIRGLICDLVERLDTQGLEGLLSFIQDNDIFEHVIYMGYPLLVEQWNRNDEELDYIINGQDHQPSYGNGYGNYAGGYGNYNGGYGNYGSYGNSDGHGNYGGYGPSYYSYGPSDEAIQTYETLQSLLATMREMGLDSLVDDFSFE